MRGPHDSTDRRLRRDRFFSPPPPPGFQAGDAEWHQYHLGRAKYWDGEENWEQTIRHIQEARRLRPTDLRLALWEARCRKNILLEHEQAGTTARVERARKEALAAYQEAAKLAGPGEGEADHHAAMLAAASDALRLAEEHVARAIEKEPALARQMLDDEGRKDDPLRALRGRERFEKLLEPAREQRTD